MILKSHPNRMLAVSNWDRKSLQWLKGIYIQALPCRPGPGQGSGVVCGGRR